MTMSTITPTITIRKSQERGHAHHDWLDSYHSFSFARYYDPEHLGYSVLRVINEDVIAPAHGFGKHSHNDMEIVTYMLAGSLHHEDSMGNGSVINAGDVQRMTAGSGVTHSEFNASPTEAAHLLQIWLLPERNNITPGYEEKHFAAAEKQSRWRLIASLDAREGSLRIHQAVDLYASVLASGECLDYTMQSGRSVYLQVARGSIALNGQTLNAGDAAKIDTQQTLAVDALAGSELLLFDLPPVQ